MGLDHGGLHRRAGQFVGDAGLDWKPVQLFLGGGEVCPRLGAPQTSGSTALLASPTIVQAEGYEDADHRLSNRVRR